MKDEGGEKKSMNIVCHYCNQPGHKASSCPANPHKENFKVSGAYCTPYFVVYVKFEFDCINFITFEIMNEKLKLSQRLKKLMMVCTLIKK